MTLEESLAAVEVCGTIDELKIVLQKIIESYGFASFGFVDTSRPGDEAPLFVGTHDNNFVEAYRSEGFVHADPILAVSRRVNIPFTWSSVPIKPKSGAKIRNALKIMQAAKDFGVHDGVTIPFHYNDYIGRRYSSNCALFWKDKLSGFLPTFNRCRHELHIILLYWAQKVVDFEAINQKLKAGFGESASNSYALINLTDRERDVLAWAGRGKTVVETAKILAISYDTVETHMRNAMHKLDAHTKTQAVVKAIYLGLIEV